MTKSICIYSITLLTTSITTHAWLRMVTKVWVRPWKFFTFHTDITKVALSLAACQYMLLCLVFL